MIGLENVRHPLNQWNARVKSMATFLLNLQRMRNLSSEGIEYAGLIQVELHEPYPNDYTKNPVT